MKPMNIALSEKVERYLQEKVKTGQFTSVNEAVNTLLLQAKDREQWSDEDIAALRAELDKGLAEADRGEFASFSAEDIIQERRAAGSQKKVS